MSGFTIMMEYLTIHLSWNEKNEWPTERIITKRLNVFPLQQDGEAR